MIKSNYDPSKTVFSISAFLLVLFVFFGEIEIVYVVFFVLFVSSLSSTVVKYCHIYWMFFSQKLGAIISVVNLFLIYYLVLYPYSILKKTLSKEIVFKKSMSESLFADAEVGEYTRHYFEKPW